MSQWRAGKMTPLILLLALLGLPGVTREVQGGNLAVNPGFESALSGTWTLELAGGAAGSYAQHSSRHRTGGNCLAVSKTNGQGYIHVYSAAPIHLVGDNTVYTFRAWFYADGADNFTPMSSLLLLRVWTNATGAFYYNSTMDGSAGWSSQSLIPAAPGWQKRVMQFKCTATGDYYLHFIVYGNPVTVYLDDVEFTSDPYTPPSANQGTPQSPYTDQQVLDYLDTQGSSTGQVVAANGRTQLRINNVGTLAAWYKTEPYTNSGCENEFGQTAGINLITVPIKVGDEFSDPGFWTGEDASGANTYNFQSAIDKIKTGLRKNREAKLVLEFWCYPPKSWGSLAPSGVSRQANECWKDNAGNTAYSTAGNLDGFAGTLPGGKYWYPSYHSQACRQDLGDAVADFINYLKTTAYWKAVVGFHILGGLDGSFAVPNYYDYSPACQASFQAWCQATYGTITALNSAWGAGYADFAAIPIPPTPASNAEARPPYLNPGLETSYRRFVEEDLWALRDNVSARIKAAAGKSVFTVAYGDALEHNFKKFLSLPSLDMAASMSHYPYRNPGYPLGLGAEGGSFALHGKGYMQELDLRSWTAPYSTEVYQAWVGAGDNLTDWQNIHRKMLGASLAQDQGYWYYDMNRYFLDTDPGRPMLTQIGLDRAIADTVRVAAGVSFRPDVCLVRPSSRGYYYSAYFNAVRGSIAGETYQRMVLETSGVPYDVYYLDDILANAGLQNYKVYIFLQNTYMSDDQITQINNLLKNNNRFLVWVYDSGYIGDISTSRSVTRLSGLVGMTVNTTDGYVRRTSVMDNNSTDNLSAGVPPFSGQSELGYEILSTAGYFSGTSRYQEFWVNDAAATPLARYVEDNLTSIAVRRFGTWRSVYIGAPNGLSGELLNNIAAEAGAYRWGLAGPAAVQMNGRFISLHGVRSVDSYVFNLPPGATTVWDVDTGNIVATGTQFTITPLTAGDTHWYYLCDPTNAAPVAIPVMNGSFELPALTKYGAATPTGWTGSAPAYYPDAACAVPVDGKQVLICRNDTSNLSATTTPVASIAQARATYTLSTGVGNYSGSSYGFSGYKLEILVNNVSVALKSGLESPGPGPNTWFTRSVSYTTTPGDVGKPLAIRLSIGDNHTAVRPVVLYDNVSLAEVLSPTYTAADLSAMLAAMDATPGDSNWNPAMDFDGDGAITSLDLAILLKCLQ